jgi:hypothetical protein
MDYQQFIFVVKEKVALSLGEGMSLQIHTALKNNGRERVGLTIMDKRVNISPTIYLEEFYKQFQNGYTIQNITERILEVYHEVKFEHTWHVHTVKDFEMMRSKIVYKLIHAKKNEVLLKSMPYIAYLDFAIIFYILFEVDESGTATIPITHELTQLWGVSLDEIQQNAFCNAPTLLPASFKPMQIVINELMGTNCVEGECIEDLMFVLTNSLRTFGAACILYDGILDKISEEIGENFYILPSSIHEMIIVPESSSPSRAHLDEMITEVNQTQVDEEEVLSDCVYYYDCKTKTLS